MISLLISEIETEHTVQGMLANLRKKALEKEKNAVGVGLLLGNFEMRVWKWGSTLDQVLLECSSCSMMEYFHTVYPLGEQE